MIAPRSAHAPMRARGASRSAVRARHHRDGDSRKIARVESDFVDSTRACADSVFRARNRAERFARSVPRAIRRRQRRRTGIEPGGAGVEGDHRAMRFRRAAIGSRHAAA
jgi:hypothetical protein